MITHLPVHPITYRVLVHENKILDSDPYPLIKASNNNVLLDHLRHKNPNSRDRLKSIHSKLIYTIAIRTNEKISNPYQVGYYLYRIHTNKLLDFVYAQYLANQKAIPSIRCFCSIYNITDDDVNMESLERLWRRFLRSKKTNHKAVNFRHDSPKYRREYVNRKSLIIPFIDDQVHYVVSSMIRDHFDEFLTTRNEFNVKMMLQALSFSYYVLAKYQQKDIAKKMECARNTISERISSFEFALKMNKDLSDTYYSYVNSLL